MTTTVRDLRNNYAQLLRRVAAGQEVTITRRGRIVARLVPAGDESPPVDWTQSAARRRPRPGRPRGAARREKVLTEGSGRWRAICLYPCLCLSVSIRG
jgi:prevent-host-death family protein